MPGCHSRGWRQGRERRNLWAAAAGRCSEFPIRNPEFQSSSSRLSFFIVVVVIVVGVFLQLPACLISDTRNFNPPLSPLPFILIVYMLFAGSKTRCPQNCYFPSTFWLFGCYVKGVPTKSIKCGARLLHLGKQCLVAHSRDPPPLVSFITLPFIDIYYWHILLMNSVSLAEL